MSTAKQQTSVRRDRPWLEQTGGAGKGRTFELSREVMTIGRTEDNEIIMKSDSVSRCHAHLKKLPGGGWHIADNNSKNGVRINGKKVPEAQLQHGDSVGIGDFTFRFFEPEEVVAVRSEATTAGTEIPASIRPLFPPPHPSVTFFDTLKKGVSLFVAKAPGYLGKVGAVSQKILPFLERNSWVAGLIAGITLGGGLWLKSTRTPSTRPGTMVASKTTNQVATPKPQASVAETEQQAPATFASEITREDLAVVKSTKPKSDIRDLKVYLREGKAYLKEGDKDSAAIAFRFALVLDPKNSEAIEGLRSAGVKVETPKAPAPTPAPKEDRQASVVVRNRARVSQLLKAAVDAFGRRSYQEAIDKAESARRIEIRGETEYLNEAKQIIDRARLKQKEDFEPFLRSAQQKIAQGDFRASAALCEEMLKMDPAYAPARECLARSLDGMAGKRK